MSSAFYLSFANNPVPFDPTSPASVLVPVKGVRGSYSVNYQVGVVPQHVDLATLAPADLDTDARAFGIVSVRIGNILIEALYRNAFGDVIYRQNGKPLDVSAVQASLTNAFALAKQ